MPQFVALLPVRDEVDVLRESLRALTSWADKIFVFDTGSTDGSAQIIAEEAAIEKRIVNLGTQPVFYNENLVRGFLFETARESLRNGDWFARVDADEFHHISPRNFVEGLPPDEGVVYHQYYNFEFTDIDLQFWLSGRENADSRAQSISERRRYYTVSEYAEPRLCRYRSSMRWPAKVNFPYNAGLVAKKRIPIRHYPHRDPPQMAARTRLRSGMMANATNRAFWRAPEDHHWSNDTWKRLVRDSADCFHWQNNMPLPLVYQTGHLPPSWKRSALRLFYRSLLPTAIDRTRPSWRRSIDRPARIPEQLQDKLRSDPNGHELLPPPC